MLRKRVAGLLVLAALATLAARRPLMAPDPNVWVQTNGPAGGRISDLAVAQGSPPTIYAVGSRDGVYRSTDDAATWNRIPFADPVAEALDVVAVDPSNASVVLAASNNDFLRSTDAGANWTSVDTGLDPCTRWVDHIVFSSWETGGVYAAGYSHCDETGGTVYHSTDSGASWTDLGTGMGIPPGAGVEALAVGPGGRIAAAVNDRALQSWRRGRLYLSNDGGAVWNEVDYGGQAEDRFIWTVFINPHDPDEIWVTEAPLFNEEIDQPAVFRTNDGGATWSPVTYSVPLDNTQLRVLTASSDGSVYLAGGGALAVTRDEGASFSDVSLPEDIVRFDLRHLEVDQADPNRLYLPTGAGGVAVTEDGGQTWSLRNEGIVATSINLIAPDPESPGVVYAASADGEGTFRSDDYGENWQFLNPGGIVHPWGDELAVDPVNTNNVWFVSDVPYIHRSRDRGVTWDVLAHPYQGENFSFFSVYAMAQPDDPTVVYALNNGFGIFKAQRNGQEWDWRFLLQSEIDYTYSLAVDPGDPDVVYSGFSRKPFETGAKVRASRDGGDNWFTALEVDSAEAVTSVTVDPTSPSTVFAASVGDTGGDLWRSDDAGSAWSPMADAFSFTTIHAWAVSEDGRTVFAGAWGGGTYRTTDGGDSWTRLEAPEAFSAAALALDPNDTDIVYLADRTAPRLYRSVDAGNEFVTWFDAGPSERRLMALTLDPTASDRLYVSTMAGGGPGMVGSLYRIDNGFAEDITNGLPRLVLDLTVDPSDPSTLYAVLHEHGVYRSTDGGATWTDISGGLPDSGFFNLVAHPQAAGTLYLLGGSDIRFATVESAGLDPDVVNGVYRSTDGGDTWENINRGVLGAGSGAIKSLTFDPQDSRRLLAAAGNGVYRSTDDGASWARDTGYPYGQTAGVVARGETVYAFTNGAGVYRGTMSPQGTPEWESTPRVRTSVAFAQVVPHPQQSDVLYATGYPGGVFKSTDGGESWHEKNFAMPSFSVDDPLRQGYYALTVSPSDPDILYLGLYGKGVYRSPNGGNTWRPMFGAGMQMYGAKVTALAVDRANANVVTVAAEQGVFRSTDGGATWQSAENGLPTRDIRVLYTNAGGELFAGTKGFGIYQWMNGVWDPQPPAGNWGVIWPMWDDRPLYQYTSLLIHPNDASRMLIGTFPQGIYVSSDGGQSWTESNVGWTNDGVFSLVTHPDDPEVVYAGTYNGVNRSLDFGATWEMWDEGMPPEQWVFSIAFDPDDPDIMYACSKNGENEGQGREDFRGTVMKSTDGGATWSEIVNGLGVEQEFYKIIVDPFDGNTLYLAAQHDGMLISHDAGATWSQWNEGLTNPVPGSNGNNVTNTLNISADGSVLYFGTAGSGVFRRTIAPILPVHRLSAAPGAQDISLNWSFDDLNGNFDRFNVYRTTEMPESLDGLSPLAGVVDTTYVDTDVAPGASYYYTVTTVDHVGFENIRAVPLGPVVLNPQTAGDFNGDGRVDFNDFLRFAGAFGLSQSDDGFDPVYDLVVDGRIDFADFLEFASLFGS